ncbi:MAG: PPC domain-containing protein, partial [Parasphingopyxis sp.]
MLQYRLSALFLSAALAAPLAAQQPLPTDGQSITGAITEDSEVLTESIQYTDLYTIAGEAGERVSIELMSDDFDAYLEIGRMEDNQFVSLRSDDDSGGDLNSRLLFTFPETGSYIVRARPL